MDKFSLFLVKYLKMQWLDCRFSMFILKQQQQNPARQFSQAAAWFSILTSNVQAITFPNLPQNLVSSLLSAIDSSRQTWHPSVVLTCISPMANEVENIFTHLFTICTSRIVMCIIHIFYPLKKLIFFVIDLQAFIMYLKSKPFIRYIKIFFCIFIIQSVKKIGLYAS